MPQSFSELKARHRKERQGYSQSLSIRVHRALSWLDKAEQCEDTDSKYIFLWIAFNAAYANEIEPQHRPGERELFKRFLSKLIEIDKDNTLYNLVWHAYSSHIRILLDNPFIFEPFWDYQRGTLTQGEWQHKLQQGNDAANRALADRDTASVLSIILSRCYTLRNQLIHGGATWQGGANREQLRDCTKLLADMVPLVITLMMDGVGKVWGDSVYPNLQYRC